MCGNIKRIISKHKIKKYNKQYYDGLLYKYLKTITVMEILKKKILF